MIDLVKLQLGQAMHDRRAHQTVLAWPLEKRLRHYFLHWGKYYWAGEQAKTSKRTLGSVMVTDALIIALAAANALEIQLQEPAAIQRGDGTLFALSELQQEMIEAIGPLFKVFEGLDHEESVNLNEAMVRSTVRITAALLRYGQIQGLPVVTLIEARWRDIEKLSVHPPG